MRYLILALVVLLLQSCQYNPETQEPRSVQSHHNPDAAVFNTQLGLAYLKQGDRPRAKRKLLVALAQAPDSPRVNAAMGYFMEKVGETERAGQYYRKAMRLAPGEGAQLNNYGVYLCRGGHYQQADYYFLKAINDVHYEQTAAAYENAGLCAMAVPNHAKAINYFTKALEQDPSRKQSLYELKQLQQSLIKGHKYRSNK